MEQQCLINAVNQAVFDMSSVILQKTFKNTTPLIDATVNET